MIVSAESVKPPAQSSASPGAIPAASSASREETAWLPIVTLTLWWVCVMVGWAGLSLPYSRHPPAAKVQEPVEAELLSVELTSDPLPPPDLPVPPRNPVEPPPMMDRALPAPAPALVAVAEPNPAIAFALPVEGPVRVVEASRAAYARPSVPETPAPVSEPVVQTLTYGQGEGKQPAPEYPVRARREGQEGTVLIRLTIGENGRVLAAEAARPAPWPLLTDAALRVVRERWRFRAGGIRVYEVSIRFEISK